MNRGWQGAARVQRPPGSTPGPPGRARFCRRAAIWRRMLSARARIRSSMFRPLASAGGRPLEGMPLLLA